MPDETDKTKPGVKIQDLSPRKDAKGGGVSRNPDRGIVNPDKGSINPDRGTVNPDKGSFNPNSGTSEV